MTFITLAQVFCRYFLGFSIIWAGESARYLLASITFIGGSIAFKKSIMPSVDLLEDKVPSYIKKVTVNIARLCSLLFMIIVSIYGFLYISQPGMIGQVSPAMRLPMNYVYVLIPIGFCFMIFYSFEEFYRDRFIKKDQRKGVKK